MSVVPSVYRLLLWLRTNLWGNSGYVSWATFVKSIGKARQKQLGFAIFLTGTGYKGMIEDQKLSEKFTLYQLTRTDHAEYLEENRKVTEKQIEKLKKLAGLLDLIWVIVDYPLIIHSGYRCKDLNIAVGSASTSQHRLCEAADFSIKGIDAAWAFKLVRKGLRENRITFGQVLYEKDNRGFKVNEWIHLSVSGDREPERCNQVLIMNDGIYKFVERMEYA